MWEFLDSVLRDIDDNDKIVGEIDCRSVSKDFVEGQIITCEITNLNYLSLTGLPFLQIFMVMKQNSKGKIVFNF